jgi:LPPG:FO 2-phospho-L-lactate transferase
VSGFHFEGIKSSNPASGVIESLNEAELIIICPSNPWVSIDPILSVPGVRDAITAKADYCEVIAVSPIIAGQAVKGPAAKMYQELGLTPSATSVAQHYGSQIEGNLLTGFVFDKLDADQKGVIVEIGLATLITNTLMKTQEDRIRLAKELITFGK